MFKAIGPQAIHLNMLTDSLSICHAGIFFENFFDP